jgi:serine/threonine protein kinase/tetratricopeptide (TPR) repeat protein
MIGQSILHYKIIEKLGEGGMGVVYLAEDQKLERKVAIKFLPSRISGSQDERERFKIEAKAAAALNHPNIATIYAIEETEEHTFISMEYIEGKELKTLLVSGENNGLEISDAIKYAIQIAEGLKAAHHKGIIHRDIKSSNIMITGDGNVKIMDFGLAKIKGGTLLTKIGTTVGTASYISPEQARGEEVDQRTDIWSFGIVLFEMLTGKLPFRSEYEQAVIYSIMNESPESAGSLRPEVLPELEIIINNCLAKKAEDRYPNAEAVIEDLSALSKGTSPAIIKKNRTISLKSRSAALAIVIIAILCLSIGVYLILKKSSYNQSTYLDNENSLAVMYFENQSDEKGIDKVLVNLLTTNLARFKGLNVISSQHLFDILKSIGKQDAQTIDMSVATEVAHEANVHKIITGSIIRIGAKFRVTVQLLDVNSGNIINSYQEDGYKEEDVFAMVDALTEKIEENFALSINGADSDQILKIRDVTTNSYEAFKHYENGLEKLWRWEVDDAANEFENALKIDSTFAMAYLQLAIAKTNNSLYVLAYDYNIMPVRDLVNRAEFYSSKATDNERWIIYINKALFDRDFQAADSLAMRFVENYPRDREANNLLAVMSWFAENYNQAIQASEKTLEIDPKYVPAYNGLAYFYSFLGDHEKAISFVKKAIDLRPDVKDSYDTAFEMYLQAGQPDSAIKLCGQWGKLFGTTPYDKLGYIYLFKGNTGKARDEYDKELKADPGTKINIILNIGFSYVYEGRYSNAITEFKKCLEIVKLSRRLGYEIYVHFDLGKTYLAARNIKEALREFQEAENVSFLKYPKLYNPVRITSHYFIGITYLKNGEYEKAGKEAERIKQLIEKDHYDSVFMDFYKLLYAAIYLSRNDYQNASLAISGFSHFTKMFPRRQTLVSSIFSLAGNYQGAILSLNNFRNKVTYKNSYMGGDPLDYLLERSRVNYDLAKVYDQKGDKIKAVEFYSYAIKQWQNADKNMPEIIDAKNRLQKLSN